MRRFFISGFERLLNVLTILSVLAVAALAARIAVEAQPGETRAYLTAAAVLVGGWLAVVAVAGVSFLAIAMHDNSRRLIGLMAQGAKGARPLTATRQPERAVAKPRPAPVPVPDHDLWDDEDDLTSAPVAAAPKASRPSPSPQAPDQRPARQNPPLAAPAPQPAKAPEAPARSVFTGRAMPRISADHPAERRHADNHSGPEQAPAQAAAQAPAQAPVAAAPLEKAPVEPAPAPLTSPSSGAPRLVAERRFPR